MPADTENTQLNHETLIKLYESIDREIQETLSKASQDSSGTMASTHNYLRAMRNEVVKLMIIQNKISSSSSSITNYLVGSYMDFNSSISSPSDRNELQHFIDEQEQLPSQNSSDKFQALISDLLSTPLENKKIIYSDSLANLLNELDEPNKKNKASLETFVFKLRHKIENHGIFYSDSDLRAMKQNPCLAVGRKLVGEINEINNTVLKEPQKSKQVCKALMKAHQEIIDLSSTGKYKDHGLMKVIFDQLEKIDHVEAATIKQSLKETVSLKKSIKANREISDLCTDLLKNTKENSPLEKEILAIKTSDEKYDARLKKLNVVLEAHTPKTPPAVKKQSFFSSPQNEDAKLAQAIKSGLKRLVEIGKKAGKPSILERISLKFQR